METIRWGILGTGGIAKTFARGLAPLPDAELVAVGSRSQASAEAFAQEFSVAHAHPTYEALAQDADVDVVYVATPHALHHANSVICLEAGKAVLCEKPFTINAHEAEEIISIARRKQLFVMEAMWTRFLPVMVRVRELLAEGVIGEVQLLQADFGFRTAFNPHNRLFDPTLGGGALLDVGVYVVSLASMVFGQPQQVSGFAHLGQTGVDEQAAMVLNYGTGQHALLSAAIRTKTPHEATIVGTEGIVHIHAPWWHATTLSLTRGEKQETMQLPYTGNGYSYEAVEVMQCLRAGKYESSVMPLAETLQIMQTLDQLRAQWGLRYPME